ncbi:MAG: ABC transporter substrate-binding protein [Sandaracinaceae bacterium]
MRSTRRSENIAGLAGLGVLAVATLAVALVMPDPPSGPRYMGAGAEEPHRGGTLVVWHEVDVRGTDPQVRFDALSGQVIKLLYEGLLDYDRDTLELVPRLAEEMPTVSEDGRTFTFRLRRGLRFQDSEVFEGGRGREIVAEDVRWSLEHMLHPDTNSPGVTFFTLIEGYDAFRNRDTSHVSGIRVVDRYTVEVRLTQPDQTFLYAMAMTFSYPVAHEAYERWGDEVTRRPVATGAFRLESWEPGIALHFVRNDNYFLASEGQPYPDRIVFEVNLDRLSAAMRFQNGEVDHLHRTTPSDYQRLRHEPAWEPYRDEAVQTIIWGVGMNCELPPFDDRHIRRAVAFALNGERWKRARAGRMFLSGQPIPSTLPGYDPDLPGAHHYDLARAREEMRLAGHPDGLDEPIQFWVGEGDTGRSYGELVQADLEAIGIEVDIRQVAFPVYLQQTGTRRTVQAWLAGWSMDYPDASNFLDILFHSRSIHDVDSQNKAFYSNPEVDRLLDEARVERDRARRLGLYRRASEIIVDDAPWGFVFSDVAMEFWQPYVRNYRPNPVWTNFYRDVWLDLPRERVAGLDRLMRPDRALAALFTPRGATRADASWGANVGSELAR